LLLTDLAFAEGFENAFAAVAWPADENGTEMRYDSAAVIVVTGDQAAACLV